MLKLKLFLITLLCVGFCFITILFLHKEVINLKNSVYFIAAFGAAVVLDLSSQDQHKTRFKVMFLGSLIGSFIGVVFTKVPIDKEYACVLAITISTALMTVFKVQYPPGGAMVLIPILGGTHLQQLGFTFLIYPVITGLCVIYCFSQLQRVLTLKLNENG